MRGSVDGSGAGPTRLPTRPLVGFFLLTYAISWATWAIPVVPTLCPMIAALVVVWVTVGRAGLRDLASRLGQWRVGLRWWLVAVSPGLFLLLIVAGLRVAGQALPTAAEFARFAGAPLPSVALFVVITLASSVGEEVGWRGYALPQLQRRFNPLSATLILAPLWWLWHLQFFVTESTLGPGYVAYLVEVTSVAIILTWLYNRSGGSILLVAVWHATYNFASVTPAVTAVLVALIVIQGVLLAILELVARRRGASVMTGDRPGYDAAARVVV